MSVQRRAFGDVKNTISGTPAALRDQKGVLLPHDKSAINSTPATSKPELRDSNCTTPAAGVKPASKTPFSVYVGGGYPSRNTAAKQSALRERDVAVPTAAAPTASVSLSKDGADLRDSCTYLPLPETYEDLRENRHINELYTLDEDDELSFNQRQLYDEFTTSNFDEDRFFEELLSQK